MRRLIVAGNVLAPVAALLLVASGQVGWALAVILVAHALWFIPTLWPNCTWFGPMLRRLPAAAGRRVWLTIDDGPDPQDTPLLLDLLDRHGARATFFVIGAKARAYPHLIREIVRRGHGLGNHTMNHAAAWFWAFGPRRIREEIEGCQQLLREIVPGVPLPWFRAPAGLKNGFVHPALAASGGLQLAGWSARGFDGVSGDAAHVLDRLRPGLIPGAVILIHEGRAHGSGERLAPKVLGAVLEVLAQRGLGCCLPIPELGGRIQVL